MMKISTVRRAWERRPSKAPPSIKFSVMPVEPGVFSQCEGQKDQKVDGSAERNMIQEVSLGLVMK